MARDPALAAAALAERGILHFLLGGDLAPLEAGVAAIAALPANARGRINRVEDPGTATAEHNRYQGALGRARGFVGPFPAVLALGTRFLAQLPAPDGADARLAVDAHLGLGLAHAMLGRPADAQRALAAARALAGVLAEHAMAGLAAELALTLVALVYQPEQLAARRQLAAAVTAELGRASSIGLRAPRLFIVALLVVEGAWAEARALALEGRSSADHARARRTAMGWLGLLARAQGEPDLARAQVLAQFPDGPATAPAAVGHNGRWDLGLPVALALDAGDLSLARQWLECHDRWLAWGGAVLGQAEGQLGWAAYHRAAGDAALARQAAQAALAHATAPRQPLALLAAHRLLGELQAGAGQHAQAAEHLAAALALADACATPYERALTLLALAALHTASGESSAATAALAEARALLVPLEATPALIRADALAVRLAASAATPAALPFGLTAREAEVLRLAARGLPSAAIAARLFVTPRTVGAHLTAIYTKLGVENRAAAIRVALDHDLH